MRPLHHATVFPPYIFTKFIYVYIYLFLGSLHSQLTVLGYLSILEPGLWQMGPSLSQCFYCRRWLHLHYAVMENPCLVPTWTLALLKKNECCLLQLKISPWCHQWSGCRTLLGNGQLTLSPQSGHFCQSEKCKTWKNVSVPAGRWRRCWPEQQSSPFSLQVIK